MNRSALSLRSRFGFSLASRRLLELIPTFPKFRNHGFLYESQAGWRLSPAYDLNPVPIDYDGVPRVTYSEPEVASVGLTETAAKDRYGADAIETLVYDLAGNGKSQILRTAGAVKLVRRKDGPVIGVHIVGSRAGELVAEAQLIYNWEALPSEVASLIHMHPTQGEALGEAHMALAGKPLHAHG